MFQLPQSIKIYHHIIDSPSMPTDLSFTLKMFTRLSAHMRVIFWGHMWSKTFCLLVLYFYTPSRKEQTVVEYIRPLVRRRISCQSHMRRESANANQPQWIRFKISSDVIPSGLTKLLSEMLNAFNYFPPNH